MKKPPMEWEEEDLNELIDAKVEESVHLEYKGDLALDRQQDRKEAAKDVSAFANAKGGVIIYGMSESKEKDRPPIPTELSPLHQVGLEKRLEDTLVNATAPRMNIRIKTVDAKEPRSGYYVVVEIPQSFAGPHMVTLGGDNRFYKRRNYQAQPMTEDEIRAAYMRSSHAAEEADRKYRELRLSPKASNHFFTQVVVLPIFGQELLVNPRKFSASIFQKPVEGAFNPTSIYRAPLQPTHRGFEAFYPSADEYEYALRLLHSGHLEWIEARGHWAPEEENKWVPSLDLLYDLHDTLRYFVRVYRDVGYFGPVKVFYRMLELKGTKLGYRSMRSIIRGDRLFPDPEWEQAVYSDVPSLSQSPLKIVQHFMDLLWNAYGYERCLYFNDKGELMNGLGN